MRGLQVLIERGVVVPALHEAELPRIGVADEQIVLVTTELTPRWRHQREQNRFQRVFLAWLRGKAGQDVYCCGHRCDSSSLSKPDSGQEHPYADTCGTWPPHRAQLRREAGAVFL